MNRHLSLRSGNPALTSKTFVNIVDVGKCSEPVVPISKIKIIKYSERDDWELCPKYHIGNS